MGREIARRRRRNSWHDASEHIARARAFVDRYNAHDVNPDEYLAPNPSQAEWDDLLKQIK
jgi:hypothetical protein